MINTLTVESFEELIKENKKIIFLYFPNSDFKKSKIYNDIINQYKDIEIVELNIETFFLNEILDGVKNSYIFFKNNKIFEIGLLV